MMGDLVTYRTMMTDSSRWARFDHRPGDIVISTPPKSGTTWTQMLCALLIFDGGDFPSPLDAMSPWLDMRIRSEDEVFDLLARQTHRRFIKTHTPLDGLPLRDDVTYLVVGRDPRDALVSWEHHMDNLDMEIVIANRARAVGLDDLDEFDAPPPPDPDPAVRFRDFVEQTWSAERLMVLANFLHHLETAWALRDRPNVGLFHFLDYQRDLIGEMARLASVLDIDLDRGRLTELAPEAGIGRMRDRADEMAPDVTTGDYWREPARFFRSGATGEWIERTTEADRARYDERVAELAPPDLARWVHSGGAPTAA